jgi:hypothetical protein
MLSKSAVFPSSRRKYRYVCEKFFLGREEFDG